MKNIVKVLTLSGILAIALNAPVRAEDFMVSSIAADPVASEAFSKMAKGHALPKWVMGNSTGSPAQKLVFAGTDVYVMSACKPHDCPAEKIAIIYNAKEKVMYGVFATSDEKTSTEKLTWLNIGGGEESIDGKTILYAALTGSLENHPDAFNYK